MTKLFIFVHIMSLFGAFLTFFGSVSYIIGIGIVCISNCLALSYFAKEKLTCFKKHTPVVQEEDECVFESDLT